MNMHNIISAGVMRGTRYACAALVAAFLFIPHTTSAYNGQVSGWVPWFNELPGVVSAIKNIDTIDTIYPFAYEIEGNGTIVDKMPTKMDGKLWPVLTSFFQSRDIEVIPTIAWFDGATIDAILSDDDRRAEHIEDIVALVEDGDYDGINIDYEQKLARTMDDFSTFLEELNEELGSALLTCAIEARTPPESRYRTVPSNIEYANDFAEIGKHCDRVQIMTYDQQRDDIKLNESRSGVPYMPVADEVWVEKVIDLVLEDMPKNKVEIGVATYGRAWDVTVAPNWYKDYQRVATLNVPRIKELSVKYNAPIGRAASGEAVMSYFPEDSFWTILSRLKTPANTPRGYENAAKALLVAGALGQEVPVRFITYSDASAVGDKLTLADKFGVRGVAIFKVDGEEDQAIWPLLR